MNRFTRFIQDALFPRPEAKPQQPPNLFATFPLSGEARDTFVAHRTFHNEAMGIGGEQDIINNTYIDLPKEYPREQLTSMYVNSWVAARIIDLLVDDVFSAGLIRKGVAEPHDDPILKLEKKLGLWSKLPKAIKAGRLYGTAFLVLAPSDNRFERELKVEDVKKDDISNLIVVDRYSMTVHETYLNPSKVEYAQPYSYMWTMNPEGLAPLKKDDMPDMEQDKPWQGQTIVHSSRCIRFDGVGSLLDEGWKLGASNRWGYSILNRVMDDILLDMLLNATGGDVAKRMAVPVLKIKGFRDMLGIGEVVGDEVSPERYAANMRASIASNRMAFIDAGDEMMNLEVGNPEGVVTIIDGQMRRLASAAGVPVTRFTGASASGLNATGEGDSRDYRMAVESYRERHIDPQVEMLMDIMARNAGVKETPGWEWGRLGEMTAMDQAETLKITSESTSLLVSSGLIDKKESREILNQLDNVNIDENKKIPDPPMPMAGAMAGAQLGATPKKNPMSNPQKKPPLDKGTKRSM
ncbi:MAG: DUF1073 domain-containing protein [Gammaproteobacteria bacterium AqS3]|nr:DUF1073 domain-containing protein [Gammaproteobacteria bacterium AqS3]